MNRIILISGLAIVGVGGLNAGSYTVGVPNAVDLTTALPGGGSVLNKSTGGSGYIPTTVTTPVPSGTATSFATVLYNAATVPFDIGSGINVWAPGNAAGNQTRVINVGNYTGASTTTGVDDVDQIWTMINDWYAVAGYQGISLTLNGWDNAGLVAITQTIDLTAGEDYRSIGTSGNDVTPCDIANIGTATLGVNCTGDTSPTALTSATHTLGGGVSVKVYNSVYTSPDGSGNNYWLDVQDISLGGAFQNGWLNSITVTSKDGGTTGVTGTFEKTILTAVTVNSIAPEPGTILLFGTGLAGLVMFQLRHSRKA